MVYRIEVAINLTPDYFDYNQSLKIKGHLRKLMFFVRYSGSRRRKRPFHGSVLLCRIRQKTFLEVP